MNASVLAMRAITGVYFQKLVTIGAVIGGILLGLLWVIIIWLAINVDLLWGIFIMLLIPLTIIGFIIYGLFKSLATNLLPRKLNKDEIMAVSVFSQKLFQTSDTATSPWFVHAFSITKDVLRGRDSRHIQQFINNSSTLREDFVRIKNIFEQRPEFKL